MQVTQRHTVTVTLILTKEEADWLKGFVQNPQVPEHQESIEDSKMREMFWRVLNLPAPPPT